MKLTKPQHKSFSDGYNNQFEDMLSDVKEHFSDIQTVMLNHPDFKSMETLEDFEDFGREAFLYKLETYTKQARMLREMKDLPNIYENKCRHEALDHITTLKGDEYEICNICNYSKKIS